MGWHDSSIHSIGFPQDEPELIFDIDYIFKWVLDEQSRVYNFWVSPCTLTFFSVGNLKFELSFDNFVGLYIQDISRRNPHPSPNGAVMMWEYVVETDRGRITFESRGFLQQVRRQPVYGNSQSLVPAER